MAVQVKGACFNYRIYKHDGIVVADIMPDVSIIMNRLTTVEVANLITDIGRLLAEMVLQE
jgi:hypothetical protein